MKETILQLTVVWVFLTTLYSAQNLGVSQESKSAFSCSSVDLNSLPALLS